MHRPYWSEVLDHLGLVAGMLNELGLGEVVDRTMHHTPETRLVTVGSAVNAMVLTGLGIVNQPLYRVPMLCRNKPTQRRIAPGVEAQHLHDDTLGRALDMLDDDGVTALYSLMAVTAAQRLGLAPTFAHLASPRFPVDGRYNSNEEPAEPGIPRTRGYSRAHRPDRHQVMRALIVDHQAGIPLLMNPLSGHSRDVQDCGQVVTEHIAPLQTTYGTTSLVADSALYSEENLQKLVATRTKWITRGPATLSEAPAVLAQAHPPPMTPLMEGDASQQAMSTDGGVPQRWLLVSSDHHRPQAQRLGDKAWRKQSAAEAKAFQPLCRTAYACAADAQHALATCIPGWQATSLHEGTVQPMPRYRRRGRPSHTTPPAQIAYPITGALASSLATHEALVAPHRCCLLATNALDERTLPAQALLEGYKGQHQAERGVRFLKDPRLLASSRYLKKPERIMAWRMVMTVCLLVYAALEYRIRQTRKAHQATFPHQTGPPGQHPTARWVFQYFVGIHRLRVPGQGAFVLNLNDQHQQLLRLLGRSYAASYS